MNSEIFARLFSRFGSKSYQGTGLGLFICKSIIQARGGRIWSEHSNVGEIKVGILLHLVCLLPPRWMGDN